MHTRPSRWMLSIEFHLEGAWRLYGLSFASVDMEAAPHHSHPAALYSGTAPEDFVDLQML